MRKTTELFMAYKSEFSKSSLKNNDLIEFKIKFNYANLIDISNGSIFLKSSNINMSIKESLGALDLAIKSNNIIRVWSSHIDPDFYMFLLFICSYINGKVDNIEVFYSDEYNKKCINTGAMTSDELDKLSLLSHTIDKVQIGNYAREWDSLNKDGSKLHIIENDKLIDVDYECIYKQIIDLIRGNGSISIVEIILYFVRKYKIDSEYLIQNLIKEKRVRIIKKDNIFSKNIVELYNNGD